MSSSIDYNYIIQRIPEETISALMTDSVFSDIDEEVIQEFISDADAIVDNAMSLRYIYPYEFTDEILGEKAFKMLRRWKFALVRQMMYARKYDDEEMKEINRQHKDVMTKLERLQKGEIEVAGLAMKHYSPKNLIFSKKNEQVFTNDRLTAYDNRTA
ncbi:MAG: DUF1320 family protein [Candidatus Kapabacteria bacterium]|nr:DUF1320 family protein [Ignavibacteriota bacterium]MCW5886395.1 DUF1320 family protein [Candidatus Kapabacteria bacterium]